MVVMHLGISEGVTFIVIPYIYMWLKNIARFIVSKSKFYMNVPQLLKVVCLFIDVERKGSRYCRETTTSV